MHMISKNDLKSCDLDTLTTLTSPTTVITANGEVQTHEEATVYVKELKYSILSSDSVTTQARGDLCGIDSYPVTVSSKDVQRQARRRLVFFWNTRRAAVH